jgi:hypothetical protein
MLLARFVPGPVRVAVKTYIRVLRSIEKIDERAGAIDGALPKAEVQLARIQAQTQMRRRRSLGG